MQNQVEIKKTFPLSKQGLFKYFTDKSLVEKWAYPNGMTLRVPFMEPQSGGKYRYEHSTSEGTYLCDGHFEEVSPSRIVQIDDSVKGPDGKTLSENLLCTVSFTEKDGGTEAQIIQSGFKSEKEANDCRQGWQQSLEHLDNLLRSSSNETLAKPA